MINFNHRPVFLSILVGILILTTREVKARYDEGAIFRSQPGNTDYIPAFNGVNRHDLLLGKVAERSDRGFKIQETNLISFSECVRGAGYNQLVTVTRLRNGLADLHYPAMGFSALDQSTDYKPGSKEYFLQRAKNQKTIAWVLLGGGTAMTIIGLIGFDANFDIWSGSEAQNTRADIFGFVTLTGMLADVISVPFFISAHHNKKMASMLSVSNQTVYHPLFNSKSLNVSPSITLKINF